MNCFLFTSPLPPLGGVEFVFVKVFDADGIPLLLGPIVSDLVFYVLSQHGLEPFSPNSNEHKAFMQRYPLISHK